VEMAMRTTLRGAVKRALSEHSCATRRVTWALQQPAQIALLASSILWAQV